MSDKQLISLQMDKDVMEKVRNIAKEKGETQVKIFHDAVKRYISQESLKKHGGILMEWTNPQFLGEETPETYESIVAAFEDLDLQLRKISPNFRRSLNILEVARFLEERLLIDPESKVKFDYNSISEA